MGSFVIQGAGIVSTNTKPGAAFGWRDGGSAGSTGQSMASPTADSDLLAGINASNAGIHTLCGGWTSGDGSPVGTWLTRFRFFLDDAIIALDGNPPISFNSLPAGACIQTASLGINVFRYNAVSPDPTPVLFFQQGPLDESGDLVQTNSAGGVTKSFAYSSPLSSTFLKVLSDGFGIRLPITFNGSVGQGFRNAQITGTYIIQSVTWTLDTTSPVEEGDEVTITSDPLDPAHLKLDEITPKLQYLDDTGAVQTLTLIPTTQTEFILIFIIPALPGINDVNLGLVALGNGVQFSGSVMLGVLQILIINGSGIYRIIPNKTNDTLYVNSPVDDTTVDAAIPDPFFKTGFIGG